MQAAHLCLDHARAVYGRAHARRDVYQGCLNERLRPAERIIAKQHRNARGAELETGRG